MIDKPQRRQIEIAIDFVSFSVPDLFVVGYGTDYAEKYRHLPYIVALSSNRAYAGTAAPRLRGCEARVGIAANSTNISRK